jgi:hypothetical protein
MSFGVRRIQNAQTNCFGFAMQMVNSIPWNYKRFPLQSFADVSHVMKRVAEQDEPARPCVIMITSRLLTNEGVGHSFVLEFHPFECRWYIFQCFQNIRAPTHARIASDDIEPFMKELSENGVSRLLEYAGLQYIHKSADLAQRSLKRQWTFMSCGPESDFAHVRSIYKSGLWHSWHWIILSFFFLAVCAKLKLRRLWFGVQRLWHLLMTRNR